MLTKMLKAKWNKGGEEMLNVKTPKSELCRDEVSIRAGAARGSLRRQVWQPAIQQAWQPAPPSGPNPGKSNRIKPDQAGSKRKKTLGGTLDDLAGKVLPVWMLGLQMKHAK
jgi:hypothetical protein